MHINIKHNLKGQKTIHLFKRNEDIQKKDMKTMFLQINVLIIIILLIKVNTTTEKKNMAILKNLMGITFI